MNYMYENMIIDSLITEYHLNAKLAKRLVAHYYQHRAIDTNPIYAALQIITQYRIITPISLPYHSSILTTGQTIIEPTMDLWPRD